MPSRLASWARENTHLAVPVALAAIVRLAHLAFVAARDPLFLHPVADSYYHAHEAQQILTKGWLLPGLGAFYKGPLYSYVLAVLFAVFGDTVGVLAGRLLSVALGCASVLLVAKIAARLAGVTAGWIAGTITALYGTAVYFDASLLLVPLVTFFVLLAAERLIVAGASENRAVALATAGAALGAASITRANALLAVGAAVLWALFFLPREGRRPSGRWQAATTLTVAALVVVAPVTLHNVVLKDDPVLVSWNGGINLFMGNDPAFRQDSGNAHSAYTWSRLYGAPEALGLERGADHQGFFVRQALSAAARDPAGAVRRLAIKTGYLLAGLEISNNRRIADGAPRSPVLAVLMPGGPAGAIPFALAAGLIGAGLVLGAGVRLRGASTPILLAAAWALAPVLFFNTARYRLPAILLLIPVAVAASVAAREARPALSRRLVAGAAGTAFACAIFAFAWAPGRPLPPPPDLFYRADVALREGRTDDAITFLTEAVAREPRDPFSRKRLGSLLARKGDVDGALAHHGALLADSALETDWHHGALADSAVALAAAGRLREAEGRYRDLLARDPDRPRTGERRDFWLHATPPLTACRIRLALAQILERDARADEAVAELGRVAADCRDAPLLAEAAAAHLARLSRRSRRTP